MYDSTFHPDFVRFATEAGYVKATTLVAVAFTGPILTIQQRYRLNFPSLPDQLWLFHRYTLPPRCHRIGLHSRRALDIVDMVYQEGDCQACNDLLLRQPVRPGVCKTSCVRHSPHERRCWTSWLVLALRAYGWVYLPQWLHSWLFPSGLIQEAKEHFLAKR